jgi:hypothetical protein
MSVLPSGSTLRIPLKCALCHQAYATFMKPGSIRELVGCSTLQVMQCVNNPIHFPMSCALDANRFTLHWRDESDPCPLEVV